MTDRLSSADVTVADDDDDDDDRNLSKDRAKCSLIEYATKETNVVHMTPAISLSLQT